MAVFHPEMAQDVVKIDVKYKVFHVKTCLILQRFYKDSIIRTSDTDWRGNDGRVRDGGDFWEMPLISAHFRSFE